MSAITFTSLTFTGTPDASDTLAAQFMVRLENARRALLDPPGTPLPSATGAQLKTSYLTVLLQIVTLAHESYIAQATVDSARFTQAQTDQIKFNLNARLDAGETAANIVTDTASSAITRIQH